MNSFIKNRNKHFICSINALRGILCRLKEFEVILKKCGGRQNELNDCFKLDQIKKARDGEENENDDECHVAFGFELSSVNIVNGGFAYRKIPDGMKKILKWSKEGLEGLEGHEGHGDEKESAGLILPSLFAHTSLEPIEVEMDESLEERSRKGLSFTCTGPINIDLTIGFSNSWTTLWSQKIMERKKLISNQGKRRVVQVIRGLKIWGSPAVLVLLPTGQENDKLLKKVQIPLKLKIPNDAYLNSDHEPKTDYDLATVQAYDKIENHYFEYSFENGALVRTSDDELIRDCAKFSDKCCIKNNNMVVDYPSCIFYVKPISIL